MIPVARPDIGRRRDRRRHRGPAQRDARRGPAGRRARGALGRVHRRRATRSRSATARSPLMCIFAGLGLGPGRRGHHRRPHVQRDGQRRSCTPARRRSSSTSSPTPTSSTPTRIEAAITPRTRAICPVHLFGLPADMDTITEHRRPPRPRRSSRTPARPTARRSAAGGSGSFGHGAFSLYGTKNMTTGEGGLITTDDDRLADWIRLYRNQGMRERYHHEILGYNFRLTDIAAAIGLCQLDKLERNTARRQAIAARYDAAFADLPVGVPIMPAGRTPRLPPVHDRRRARARRDRRRARARPASRPASTTRSRSTASRTSWSAASTPTCRSPTRAAARTLSLPMYPGPDRRRAGRRSSTRSGRGRRRRGTPARRRRADDGRAGSPSATRDRSRVGLIGLGSMGRNHLRILGARAGRPARRRRRSRCPRRSTRRRPATGAQGYAEPLAMLAEAELDAVVIAAPTTDPPAARARRRSSAGSPSSSRSRSRRRSTRPTSSWPRRSASRRAGPGRPRRALQPGGPRARPAARTRAGCRRSTRSRAAAPARSRRASATSG